MNERQNLIARLLSDVDTRASYIKAKLGVLVPSRIRSLRLQSDMPRQSDLARAAKMHQSRISTFETPGAANMTIETLSRLAAAFKVGLVIEFVPMSDMLKWENKYSQDTFSVTRLDEDVAFLDPSAAVARENESRAGLPVSISDARGISNFDPQTLGAMRESGAATGNLSQQQRVA